ncbi:hypothetical protein EDF72_1750 [Delftia acidovorans]|uniref:hypothetical protein n=1 Tax=Delftia acidovorans TaxID=80866 RepID=UPI000F4C49DC|nr:hypothetical protein [Delftia acidovorans]ROR02616.1 hypothetical protein EDF72_1750 [Delftia acidovorans]
MANPIVIAVSLIGPGEVQIETNLQAPRPGAPLAPQEAAALELVQQGAKQPSCRRVLFDTAKVDPDTAACIDLVRELFNPEGFAHSVSAEVRNAARRACGIKGQQEGLAA